MAKRYRVTQRNQFGQFGGSKTYRWLWRARLSAWMNSGESPLGLFYYSTQITKED